MCLFDIEGFGFKTVDRIAKQNGLSLTHPNRIGAGCIYVLKKSVQDGHVYLPVQHCLERVIDLLAHAESELSEQIVVDRLTELNKDQTVIIHEAKVYLPSL